MAAERATAAEMMAPAAAVVMVGVILGLGRVGGGSGWRQRAYGGQHFEICRHHFEVPGCASRCAAAVLFPTYQFTSVIGGEVRDLILESLHVLTHTPRPSAPVVLILNTKYTHMDGRARVHTLP